MSEDNSQQSAAPAVAPTETQEVDVQDSGADLEASTEASNAAEGEAKPQASAAEQKKVEQALKKAYELQINGKSKKVEIDVSNDEEVKKYLQKAMAADEKFQEAAMTRKQAEQLVNLLQTDPLKVLKNPALGLNIKELAERILLQDLEEQQKSPEQKQLEEMQEKLRSYEEEKKRLEEEKRQESLARLQAEQQKTTEESMISALENSNIPATPFSVRRVADIMINAIESGWENVTIEQIMPYAEEMISRDYQEMVKRNSSPDKLEKLIGKDILDGYRKSKISKAKTPITPGQIKETAAPKSAPEDAPKKKLSYDDIW